MGPLFQAVREGNLETVKALLEAGADVNKTLYGGSLLYLAMLKWRFDMVVCLLMAKDHVLKSSFMVQ